ncbi:MAG: exo-alpha-sialidase [Spirochaetes bacterium]|nr:exo-alpha-sialidase [Spirochaetota bacterium]
MKNAILKIYLSNFKLKHIFMEILSVIFLISVVIFLFTPGEIETSPSGWNNKISFTPAGQNVTGYSALSKGNLIALAYEAEEKGVLSLFVKISLNSGKFFFNPVKISDANLQQRKKEYKMNPYITVSDNGKFFLVWQDFDEITFEPKIYYAFSDDYGANWSGPDEFNITAGVQFLPKIIYDGKNRLHVFYHVYEKDAFYLYHIYETGGKGVFSLPERLVKLTGTQLRGAFFPAIANSGNEMYIIWQGKGLNRGSLSDDLFFMHSSDYGKNFSKSVKITTSPKNDASPGIFLFNSKIYCTYLNDETGNWEIFLTESDDNGRTWSEQPVKIFETNLNSYDPVMSSDSRGNPVFFWYNIEDGKNKIFSRKILLGEGERKFSEIQNISQNKTDATAPSVMTFENNITCLWLESGSIKAKSSDTYAAPPEVFSSTHPFEKWSKNSIAYINWKKPADESGIAGYATIINRDPNFNPTVQNYESNIFSTRSGSLDDGINYFHIRTIDNAGNFSRTVHYPLMVSSTPLQMPLITSDTHKEGEKTNSRNVTLRWTQADEIRVKGFRYSLSLNSLSNPDKFISGKEISFDQLADGRYFFQIQGVDKTNTYGRTATYEIVIGDVPDVGSDFYEKIAKAKDDIPVKSGKPVFFKPEIPEFEIALVNPVPLKKPEVKIRINIKNADKLKGVSITGIKTGLNSDVIIHDKLPEIENPEFTINDLSEGTNSISVSLRYQYSSRGKIIEKWTETATASVEYKLPDKSTPLENFEKKLLPELAASKYAAVAVILLLLVAWFNSFNRKSLFYLKSFFTRTVLSLKLIVSNLI